MNITIARRGCGKTTKLIRRSAEENLYILVATEKRAFDIVKMAKEMDLEIPYPVTVDEYFRGHKFRGSSIHRDGLLIDDADDVLKAIFFGISIKEITLTDHDKDDDCVTYLNYGRKENKK